MHAVERGWLVVRPVGDLKLVELLLSDLHRGESEAIALARETKADLLLLAQVRHQRGQK